MFPTWLWAWIGIASTVAFLVAGWDKAMAKRRRPRVPEAALLFIALVGGLPGLLLGMLVFRHKTRKASFLLRLALVVAVHAAVVVVWVGR